MVSATSSSVIGSVKGLPPGLGQARGAVDLAQHVLTLGRAHVPKLRGDQAAGGVHLVDDLLPGRQFLLTVETRDVGVVQRGVARDARALGDDQADLAFGAAAVIGGHVVGGHAAGRERPGHRRHHHPIGQFQRLEFERLEQGVEGHGDFRKG
jgi:hypothetical protein